MATQLAEAYTDDQGHLCLLRELPFGEEPPKELVLFFSGINDTTKGALLYDAESVSRTREAYEDKGQKRLPFDYDHGMLRFFAGPDSGKAAGWWTPTWPADGSMMASDIEWTPAAEKGIRDKEWMHYSPAVDLVPTSLEDGAPRRVVRVVNAAITNLPATKRQKPMLASENTPEPGATREDKDDMSTELLKLLGATTEAEAITALSAITALHGALFDALSVDGIEKIAPAVKRLKEQAAEAGKLAAKLTELEGKLSADKLEQLITRLHDDGRLAEAAFGWARTLTVEQLEAYGKVAQPDPKKFAGHDPAVGAGGTTVVLTDAQRQAARLQGFTEAEYIEAVMADKKAEAELRDNTQIVRRAD